MPYQTSQRRQFHRLKFVGLTLWWKWDLWKTTKRHRFSTGKDSETWTDHLKKICIFVLMNERSQERNVTLFGDKWIPWTCSSGSHIKEIFGITREKCISRLRNWTWALSSNSTENRKKQFCTVSPNHSKMYPNRPPVSARVVCISINHRTKNYLF